MKKAIDVRTVKKPVLGSEEKTEDIQRHRNNAIRKITISFGTLG
jgi:hypothetical protein